MRIGLISNSCLMAVVLAAGCLGLAGSAAQADAPPADSLPSATAATVPHADPAAQADAAAQEQADSDLLASPYRDEMNGFQIRPPLKSHVVQRSGLELANFICDQKQWGANVRLSLLEKQISMEDLLKATATDVSAKFKAVQVLESKTMQVSGKPSGKLVVSMMAGDGPARQGLLRQQCIVQTGDRQYYVLTMFSPLESRDDALATFDAMVRSFKIIDARETEDRRHAAIAAGNEWMHNQVAENLLLKLEKAPHYFRIKVNHRDVGYVAITESQGNRDGKAGIVLLTESTTFREDGAIILGKNESFWAFSRGSGKSEKAFYSMWEDNLQTRRRDAVGTQNTRSLTQVGLEEREPDDRLSLEVTSTAWMYTDPHDALRPKSDKPATVRWKEPLPEDYATTLPNGQSIPPMAQPPTLLPAPLEYLWTRLVDLHKPTQMAFVGYNAINQKLALRTLSVIGPETITVGADEVAAFHLTNELDPGTTDIWVDSDGKVLIMKTSDGTLLEPTTADEMRQMWAGRLK